MDSFEQLVATVLERKGFWTRTCLKVNLTDDDRAAIGRTSSPRWELDVVGYQGRENHIIVLECKSYIDSKGVQVRTFAGRDPKGEKRYKLFFEETTRNIVLTRLRLQLVSAGLCAPEPRVTFGLAAGKILGDDKWLKEHFEQRGWDLWTPAFIQGELRALADSKYENSLVHVVTKLLVRGAVSADSDDEEEDESCQ